VLVFVVDALRLDAACKLWDEPTRIKLGVSNFGSTRKQHRLLFEGEIDSLGKSLFVPAFHEKSKSETRGFKGKPTRDQVALVIDHPLTASRETIGLTSHGYFAPGHGIQDALISGNFYVPVSSWLWNILGSAEGTNPWARFGTFLQDVGNAQKRSRIVIAHTVWLQHPPYSWKDLRAARGSLWWTFPASSFRVLTTPVQGASQETAIDAQRFYMFRANEILQELGRFVRGNDGAVLITSDHGQRFSLDTQSGLRLNGVHGWNFDPDELWIPFIPIKGVEIKGDGLITWYELRGAISKAIQTLEDTELLIDSPKSSFTFQIPYISLNQLHQGHAFFERDDVLTPERIARSMSVSWGDGWVVDDNLVERYPAKSSISIQGAKLVINNPGVDSRYFLGYSEVDSTEFIQHGPLDLTCRDFTSVSRE